MIFANLSYILSLLSFFNFIYFIQCWKYSNNLYLACSMSSLPVTIVVFLCKRLWKNLASIGTLTRHLGPYVRLVLLPFLCCLKKICITQILNLPQSNRPLIIFTIFFCMEHKYNTIETIDLKHHRWIDHILEKYNTQEP